MYDMSKKDEPQVERPTATPEQRQAAAAFQSVLGQSVFNMGQRVAQHMAVVAVRSVEAMRGGPVAVLFWDNKALPEPLRDLVLRPKAQWYCLVPPAASKPFFCNEEPRDGDAAIAQGLADGSVLFNGPNR